MGKILNVIFGIIFLATGIFFLVKFWDLFISLLKGIFPIILIFAGGLAITAGINEIVDRVKLKSGQ